QTLLAQMKLPHPLQTRRRFLQSTAALALGAPAFLRTKSPTEKLNIAIIGCGGRGGANLGAVSSENIVALCDVNEKNLAAAAAKHPDARTYTDYRKLPDAVHDIDAVVVSSTEHTHAFATLPALKAGKHVHCEK